MRIKRAISLLVMFLLLGAFTPPLVEGTDEYNLKAAFVYRFTNYIEWDTNLATDEFVIGVVGNSPITTSLNAIAKSQLAKGKKIVVRQFDSPAEIGRCHILFIPQKTPFSLFDIMAKVPARGMLTISEKPGYASLGTGINFILVDDKLKFEINTKALYSSGLTASSQLLKLAVIVN
ncbi:MAG: YfiR family protein [Chitinophagales bacterium]|jgi:hypothetical protein|nr:YfiR family protein [Chitinophagales bacterium]